MKPGLVERFLGACRS